MNLTEIRALAQYHAKQAELLFASANMFAPAGASGEVLRQSEVLRSRGAQHLKWSEQLGQLASAFQTLSELS